MSGFTIPLWPEQASDIAGEVDAMFVVWLVVSLFFTVLIALLILFFIVRYRRRSEDEVGKSEHAGIWLEVAWSAIPLLIMLAMFGWGARLFFVAHRAPPDAVEYWAFGKQWMWKFQHPEGNREINHLHVPLGQAIKLSMTSEDVIHDFAVPAFRIKQDVNPGTYTFTWFRPTKVGTYHLFCDQYCGAEHSKMVGSVIVMDPRDYAAWLAGGAASGQTPAAAGGQLFQSLACYTCHEMGPGRLARGPSLQGLFGRQVELEGGGTVLADEAYIRESILQPLAKITRGWQPIMPTYQGQVSEEQVAQLVAFIKSVGNAPAMGTGAVHPPGTLAPGNTGITGAASAPAAPGPPSN